MKKGFTHPNSVCIICQKNCYSSIIHDLNGALCKEHNVCANCIKEIEKNTEKKKKNEIVSFHRNFDGNFEFFCKEHSLSSHFFLSQSRNSFTFQYNKSYSENIATLSTTYYYGLLFCFFIFFIFFLYFFFFFFFKNFYFLFFYFFIFLI